MCNKCDEGNKNKVLDQKNVKSAEPVVEPAEEAVQAAEPAEEAVEPTEPIASAEDSDETTGKVEGFLQASQCAEEILKVRESELEANFQSVRNILLRAVEQARVNGMDAKNVAEMKAVIPAMTPRLRFRLQSSAKWRRLAGKSSTATGISWYVLWTKRFTSSSAIWRIATRSNTPAPTAVYRGGGAFLL